MPKYTRRAVYNVGASITVEITHDGTISADHLEDKVNAAAAELLRSSGLTLRSGDVYAEIAADVDGVAPDEETDLDENGNPVDLDVLED